MENYENPDHPLNGPTHWSGLPCIEKGCEEPAGTAWGPYWCFKHNVERLRRIDAGLRAMSESFKRPAAGGGDG